MKTRFFHKHTRYGINHPVSFSLRLTINFVLSTFIPFALISLLMVHFFTHQQTTDMLETTRSHMDSLSQNINMYLSELEQATLMPYYDENFSYYLSQKNTEQSLTWPEQFRIRQSLDNMINFIRITRSDIQNVLIVNKKDCLFYSTSLFQTSPESGYPYDSEAWYQDAVAAPGDVILLPIHTPSYLGNSGRPVFSLVRSLINLRTRIPYAVIKVDVPADVFDALLKNVSLYVDSSLFLLDENQNLIYTNNETALQLETENTLAAAGSDSLHAEINGKKLLHELIRITPWQWSLHVFMDQSAIMQKQKILYLTALLLYLCGIVLALISYLGISRSMVRSFRSISDCLNAFKKGNFDKRYTPASHDELAFLGESINDMGQQLDALIQQEYVSTLQRKEAEMKALQSQIQPHFLFNTLGSLIALNQLGQKADVEKTLFALSALLRYVVDSPTIVPLQDELTFSRHYFELQKLRFGPKITYSIQCPERLDSFPIPELVLQPYFENAIIHGIEPCDHNCTIVVKVLEKERGICIIIQDDGAGFQENSKIGVGMQNSENRLRHIYPQSSVTVKSGKGTGCCVIIDIQGETNHECPDC